MSPSLVVHVAMTAIGGAVTSSFSSLSRSSCRLLSRFGASPSSAISGVAANATVKKRPTMARSIHKIIEPRRRRLR